MTTARPVAEEFARERTASPARRPPTPGSREKVSRFPQPRHPTPPVVIRPRRAPEHVDPVAPGDLGRPDAAAPTRAGELSRPVQGREDRYRRRLAREKLLVVLALLAILAVTLLLLGLQWLGSATPNATGAGGTVALVHSVSAEGGP